MPAKLREETHNVVRGGRMDAPFISTTTLIFFSYGNTKNFAEF